MASDLNEKAHVHVEGVTEFSYLGGIVNTGAGFQQNWTTSTIDLIITMLVFILLLFFFHLSYVLKENVVENVELFIILRYYYYFAHICI